jgi:hypothetical protein
MKKVFKVEIEVEIEEDSFDRLWADWMQLHPYWEGNEERLVAEFLNDNVEFHTVRFCEVGKFQAKLVEEKD